MVNECQVVVGWPEVVSQQTAPNIAGRVYLYTSVFSAVWVKIYIYVYDYYCCIIVETIVLLKPLYYKYNRVYVWLYLSRTLRAWLHFLTS